jgi:hypothetical protein
VREGVTAEVETLSATLAGTLVGQWQEFCTNHGVVCQLAAENDTFRTLIDDMPLANLPRLVQLVDFFWVELDAEKLAAALDDGTFAKLLAAPPDADAILGWTGSPAATLTWMEVAGDQLPKVVELRLFETIDPLTMTTLSLAALLAIGDNSVIHKLRELPTDQLLILLQLPTEDLEQVAATATAEELGWLAVYLPSLSSQQAANVAHELASGQVTIAALQAPPIVVASSSQGSSDSGSSSDASTSDASSDSASSGSSSGIDAPTWSRVVPKEVVAVWTPWANNGVAVAATVVVLLLIIAGVALALRRQMTHPPV